MLISGKNAFEHEMEDRENERNEYNRVRRKIKRERSLPVFDYGVDWIDFIIPSIVGFVLPLSFVELIFGEVIDLDNGFRPL